MLVYLASIIQYNIFLISHRVFFSKCSSFILVSTPYPRSYLCNLRSSLNLHIAHPPSHTISLYVNHPHSVSCRSLPREIASLRNDFDSPDLNRALEATLRNSDWRYRSRSDRCAPSTAPDNVYISDNNESYVQIAHPKSPPLRIRRIEFDLTTVIR